MFSFRPPLHDTKLRNYIHRGDLIRYLPTRNFSTTDQRINQVVASRYTWPSFNYSQVCVSVQIAVGTLIAATGFVTLIPN